MTTQTVRTICWDCLRVGTAPDFEATLTHDVKCECGATGASSGSMPDVGAIAADESAQWVINRLLTGDRNPSNYPFESDKPFRWTPEGGYVEGALQ